jgi:photosystem II stability/assembly factor-like uncharacterized protein
MDNGTRPTRITTGWRIALVAAPLLLTLATAGLAAPSWKPLPPFGGQVLVLAAAEGAPLLYAGTETAGPARSSNGGATWMTSQVPEPVSVIDLAVDLRNPRVVFAAAVALSEVHSAGVLRSLDGGASWQPANRGLGDETPLRVQDLAVDPSDPQKLYAATADGLFLTRDRGASWQQVGLDGSFLFAVAVDPFRPGVLFASADENQTHEAGLFVSLDGGATWTSSDQGIEGDPIFQALVFHPTTPNTLYALGNLPTIGTYFPAYVSRDGGATWTSLGEALISLAFGPAGVLFGVSGYGVLKSVDGGLHWTLTGPSDIIKQVLRVNGRLYAAGYQGVWISTDNGAHWRPSSQGLSARSLIRGLKESRSGLYSIFGGQGVFASRTGGTSWQQLRDPDHPEGLIDIFLAAGPDADYAREDFGGNFIVRSTDGGATWSELADPGLGGSLSALAVDPRHPAILYAGSVDISDVPRCHLSRSLDTGRTWTCVAEEVSVSLGAIAVERRTSMPYLITAGNIFALVGGTKLESRSTGLPPNGVDEIAFDRRRAGTLYAVTNEGIFKTLDGGKSWMRLSRGLPAGKAYSVAVDPHRRDVVYVGFKGRVYRSLNAGRTWQPFGNGLPDDTPIEELLASATNARRLYAVVEGHGLYWQAR